MALPGDLLMQSQYGGRLRKLKKNAKALGKHSLLFFYESVAGDPVKVAMGWRLLGVQCIEAFLDC